MDEYNAYEKGFRLGQFKKLKPNHFYSKEKYTTKHGTNEKPILTDERHPAYL